MIKRFLSFPLRAGDIKCFWGGPRTGKTTYLKQQYPSACYLDCRQYEVANWLGQRPAILREWLGSMMADSHGDVLIVDHIQAGMDMKPLYEVLQEEMAWGTILVPTMVRPLQALVEKGLPGRWEHIHFQPLMYPEIADTNLLPLLNRGLLPSAHGEVSPSMAAEPISHAIQVLIERSALVRQPSAFQRFFQLAAFEQGKPINHLKMAQACGVHASTIKAYYQLLVDTMVGYLLFPYAKGDKRQVIRKSPTFYFYDNHLVNQLTGQTIHHLAGDAATMAFRHYLLLSLMGYQALSGQSQAIHYWRCKTGVAVDFLMAGGQVAIQGILETPVRKASLKGLVAYAKTYRPLKALAISLQPIREKITLRGGTDILILPWQAFQELLWGKRLV